MGVTIEGIASLITALTGLIALIWSIVKDMRSPPKRKRHKRK